MEKVSLSINKNTDENIIRRNTVISFFDQKKLLEAKLDILNSIIYHRMDELKTKAGLRKYYISCRLCTDDIINEYVYAVNEEQAQDIFLNSLHDETNELVSSWSVDEVEETRGVDIE